MWLLVLPVVLISLVACAPSIQAGIMTGPIVNPSNGHTYYLLTQNNWSNSEAEDVSLGGHLVTINDAAENAWVVSTFANFGGVSPALWVGLNDSAVEGTFVWASGEPVEYTNWGPGEPNNHTGIEDWAHIFPSQDGRFPTWNDAPDSANAFCFVFNGVMEVAAATTWTVCASSCDYSSIQAAIAAPTTRDGDTLAIAAGTYTEPGITVNKSLTLQGEAAATTIVQAAATLDEATDRVFYVPKGITVTIHNLTIRYGHERDPYNLSAFGSGLYNAGRVTLSNSTVRANRSVLGGGLYNDPHGTLILINSTITSNSAEGGGGGIWNAGTMTITASTIHSNTCTNAGGGGIYNYTLERPRSMLTLTNSTISGNHAALLGGGIYNTSTLTITASTISNNATRFRAGGLYSDGTLMLTNSIVATNLNGRDCLINTSFGSFVSHGYNIDSDGSCQLTAFTDWPGTDPLLGPLQENGGPTRTHALLPGSPAINAIPWGTNGCGTTVIGDQRWQARPQPAGGPCDIGSYEVAVAGQALGGWVTGVTPRTVVCENVTTGQEVTLSAPESPWDCEAAGLGVTPGDHVALRMRGPVTHGAKDVGGAVARLAPYGGGCTNRTTGQAVTFEALFQGERGATAASCVAAGLVVRPGDQVQMRVGGAAE